MKQKDGGPVLVGVGGWAYLPIKHANKLRVCSKLYDFVELNSTYYKLPKVESAIKWRKLVPDDFEFTVRTNGKLTHGNHLRPTEENFRIYDKMLEICRALDARILHFQFPPSFKVTREVISDWRSFFKTAEKRGVRRNPGLNYAFEVRSSSNNNSAGDSSSLQEFYDEFDIIPTGDASRSDVRPSSDSKILYTRVFGPGDHTKWSFDSNEIENLKKKVESIPARRRYVTFHNITMYDDASRFKSSVHGEDREITLQKRLGEPADGGESLRRTLLLSRVKFPVSKQELEKQVGWKTFDTSGGRKVHVSEPLNRLEDEEEKKYNSVDEIMESLLEKQVV